MQGNIIKKIVDGVDSYVRYLMCVFAFLAILGVLIPTKVGAMGVYLSFGNYFGMKAAGRAVVVIIFSLVYIGSALFFRNYFGAVSFVAALVVVIAAGVAGLAGPYSSAVKGGIKIIRAARIWMLILAIINSAVIAVKQFVTDKMAD